MAFEGRFALLHESGQVSSAAIEAATAILTGVVGHLGRPLNEETDAMAATHLVMAMERMARGEAIAQMPSVVVDEARTYAAEWEVATALLSSAASRFGRPVPLAEVCYLTIHLRSLKGEHA